MAGRVAEGEQRNNILPPFTSSSRARSSGSPHRSHHAAVGRIVPDEPRKCNDHKQKVVMSSLSRHLIPHQQPTAFHQQSLSKPDLQHGGYRVTLARREEGDPSTSLGVTLWAISTGFRFHHAPPRYLTSAKGPTDLTDIAHIHIENMSEPRFEWDPDKNAENQRKHDVSFREAATA